jgi:hypothetical protein
VCTFCWAQQTPEGFKTTGVKQLKKVCAGKWGTYFDIIHVGKGKEGALRTSIISLLLSAFQHLPLRVVAMSMCLALHILLIGLT